MSGLNAAQILLLLLFALSLAAEADRTAAERRRDAGDVAADGGDGGWDGSAAQSADLSEYDVGMW